ncbi:SPOR domain-containing protein [Reinekea marina]|uniref:SPOR domain-containing protein n=1 Tax=Reinekea marina TaxID=1310421 RepID=A0ABV7WRP9_9GAMM|nr:SPOR domain-containing protein [Reinekea marina]MDN3650636.1 SPOR domain-containing protein [Reinekea marina]
MSRDFAHKPKQAETSRIPKWVWLFTSIVAVGFVGFLYFLAKVPPAEGGAEAVREQFNIALKESTTETEPQPAPKIEQVEEIKEKTETLKQAFEFYQLLQDDEVPTVAPEEKPGSSATATNTTQSTTSEPPKAKSWIIQVASFSRVDDADRLRAELILNGLPSSSINTVNLGDKGTYHRVVVGPFDNRSALNKAQDRLAALNHQVMVRAQ